MVSEKILEHTPTHMLTREPSTPVGGGGERYTHIRTLRVCAARKPPTPFFWPWPLLNTLLFRPGPLQKTHFSKIYYSLFRFSNLSRSKRPSFLKNISFSVILAPKSPVFPVSGRSESPPFSVRDRSLSPQFLIPVRHIYEYHPRGGGGPGFGIK